MTVLTFLSQLITLTCHITASLFLAPPRFSKRTLAIIWGCYGVLFLVLGTIFSPAGIGPSTVSISFLVTGSLSIALFFFTTKGAFPQRLFLMLSYVACFCTCIGLLEFVQRYVTQPSPWLMLLVSILVFALMLFLLLCKMLPIFKQAEPNITKGWWLLCLTVLLYLLFFIYQLVWPFSMKTMQTTQVIGYFFSVVLYYFTYLVIFMNIRNMALLGREHVNRLQLELLQTQVDAQTQATQEARRTRHDVRHHNSILAAYARAGNMVGLLQYLEQQEWQSGSEREAHAIVKTTP